MPMSKLAAVKIAMEKLGANAKTPEIQAYLKDHYNLIISKPMCSTYKSNVKNQQAETQETETENRQPEEKEETKETEIQETDIIEDIETLKDLIARHGPDGVIRLVRALTNK